MKVKFSFIDNPINLEKHINLLSIKNNFIFNKFFFCIRNDFNDSILIEENFKELDLKRYALFIGGIFDLNINSKRNLSLLYAEENKTLSLEDKDAFEKINKQIISLLEIIKSKSFYDLDYDPDITVKDLFEAYNLRLSVSSEEDFSNYLNSYIDICSKLLNLKIIIAYDVLHLLTNEEIKSMEDVLKRNNVYFLDILFGEDGSRANNELVSAYHIDDDFIEY